MHPFALTMCPVLRMCLPIKRSAGGIQPYRARISTHIRIALTPQGARAPRTPSDASTLPALPP